MHFLKVNKSGTHMLPRTNKHIWDMPQVNLLLKSPDMTRRIPRITDQEYPNFAVINGTCAALVFLKAYWNTTC